MDTFAIRLSAGSVKTLVECLSGRTGRPALPAGRRARVRLLTGSGNTNVSFAQAREA
ncbi:MAG: hypothetical protein RIC35_17805 [Marinoscillum sp.]